MACSSASAALLSSTNPRNSSYISPKSSSNLSQTLSFSNSSSINFRSKSLRSNLPARASTTRHSGFVVKAVSYLFPHRFVFASLTEICSLEVVTLEKSNWIQLLFDIRFYTSLIWVWKCPISVRLICEIYLSSRLYLCM